MAKIDPKKMKSAAAGAKKAASMGGIKAPMVPKPRVQTPEQLKKQAQAKAKARAKAMMRILIVTAVLAVVGLVVYFVKFHGRMPKDAFQNALEYAYKNDVDKFRTTFTTDSVELVENDPDKANDIWLHLIDGITPTQKPEVLRQDIEANKGIKTAELSVKIDGHQRTVHMRQEDGTWKINLNVAINPRKVTLPDDIPPEYIENFETSDEPEAWWEEGEEKKDDKKKKGFFAKFKK
jgi:hypothetical protein